MCVDYRGVNKDTLGASLKMCLLELWSQLLVEETVHPCCDMHVSNC